VSDRAPGPPEPLVSCIMPTYNRRRFVPLAVRNFLAQDYPNRELVVIDDGSEPVADLVENVPRVRYFRLPGRVTIGEKRNLACELAAGSLIAHWDDDDWYAPRRLSYQVGPILAGTADITGLVTGGVLVLPAGEFWGIRPWLHQQMFVGDVHGGTLVFRKELLDERVRYPAASLAEDAAFLRAAIGRGGRLCRLANDGTFVYVRHGVNAWQFDAGRHLNPGGWHRADAPDALSPEVLERYRSAVRTG
jgi:O-antigen biosynthesis protein